MKSLNKNNKGFSLVELVVVVLIMAIVAVALAPQVIKWVENSRIASDLQTKADLENACKLAMTDNEAFEAVEAGGYEIYLEKGSSGETVATCIPRNGATSDADIDADPFWHKFFEVANFDNYAAFKDTVKIKCNATSASEVSMRIYVYEGGHTFSELQGFTSDAFSNS